ncbi:ester cyclase [Pseudoroseomonas globiformis]|uniref:Ester cyclase n=1 Tax=Teichococcus globiformis TaxID=2307229 RepID=A0ABV7G7P4_9PROT
MPDDELHEFFGRYVAALNTHEFVGLSEFMEDNLIVNGRPATREQVIAGLEGHIAAVPDLVWRTEHVAVERGQVAARFINKGTPIKEWLGAEPNGATVEYAEHTFHKVRDGKFYELNFLLDEASVRNQLGS